MSKLFIVFFILATLGLLDASYLTYEHFAHVIPPCSIHAFLADCGAVLTSKYSVILGIPVSFFGALYYLSLLMTACIFFVQPKKIVSFALVVFATLGALVSLGFIALQLFVLHAICVYCMTSDTISVIILVLVWYMYLRKQLSETNL